MPPKRKSDATLTPNVVKKSRTSSVNQTTTALISAILADPDGYPIPDDDNVIRNSLLDLAHYARSLEEELNGLSNTAVTAQPSKTSEQLQAAVENLRKAALSGIK